MERDFRYKMEHMGDLFVEMLEDLGKSITGRVGGCFTGVIVTRNIHGLEKKRQTIVYHIGERLLEIRKDDVDLLNTDERMAVLFSEVDNLDGNLDGLIREREKRLDRIRGKIENVEAENDLSGLAEAVPA